MNYGHITTSIHREGYKFIGIGLLVSVICLIFCSTLFWALLAITSGITMFFRNPRRVVPNDTNLIVSPVDGTVCNIVYDVPPSELELGEEKRYRISVFLSLFDVHVNRTPAAGKVKKVIYSPGQFLNASIDKSSLFNERNTVVLELNGDSNNLMSFSQIAGTIARRIVCDIHDGQEIKKGEVFGLIRFGSRSDIWLPIGAIPQVYVGQTTISGETILSDISIKDVQPREGSVIQ